MQEKENMFKDNMWSILIQTRLTKWTNNSVELGSGVQDHISIGSSWMPSTDACRKLYHIIGVCGCHPRVRLESYIITVISDWFGFFSSLPRRSRGSRLQGRLDISVTYNLWNHVTSCWELYWSIITAKGPSPVTE